MGVCNDCDYRLNEMTLEFFAIPNREMILKEYREYLGS